MASKWLPSILAGLLSGKGIGQSLVETRLRKTKAGRVLYGLRNLGTFLGSLKKPSEQLGQSREKPVAALAAGSKLTPGMEYDPAAEKLLPGQRGIEMAGKSYRVPSRRRSLYEWVDFFNPW